jgi:hypothetical protein
MELVLLIALLAVHLYFLYYTFTNWGILWTIVVLVVPIVGLYVYFKDWHALKTVFLIELSLSLVLGFLSAR